MMTVSIITTFYNAEKWISESVQSVLGQTHTDIELILFNDGSTDSSFDICKELSSMDNRIVLVNGEKIGRTNAMIAASEKATGEFICLVDADDFIVPYCIEQCLNAFDADPSADMVYTHYREMDENGEPQCVGSRCRYPYSRDRLLRIFNTFHFRLIRKSAFDAVGGYDKRYDLAADYDLCLKLSEKHKIIKLPEILYFYRIHGESVSSQNAIRQNELARQAQRESRAREESS